MATKILKVFNNFADRRGVVSHSVENGVVRMKILVKREDLQQVLKQVTNKSDENIRPRLRPSASKSLEQRLMDMKRTRIVRSRQMKRDCRRYWRPALESIPEAGVLTN